MKFFILFLLLLFFQSCSSPTITFDEQSFYYKNKKQKLNIQAQTLSTSTIYFPPISYTQTIKKLHSTYISVDSYKCDSGYLFGKSIYYITSILYKPTSLTKIGSTNNLYFFRLQLQNKHINMIVQNNNKKELIYYYPVETKIFSKLLEDLSYPPYKKEGFIATSKKQLPTTTFSTKTIILDGIVKRINYKIYF